MEAFSTLRCLPKRSVICLFFICMMFLACAFYTLYNDSSNPISLDFADIHDFEKGEGTKSHEAVVFRGNRFEVRELSNTEPPSVFQAFNKSKLLSLAVNTSKQAIPVKSNKSVQVTTKYIYLKDATTSSSTTASSTSISVTATTEPAPIDTCSLTMEDSKLILLWTPFFDYWNYLPKEHFNQCSRCRNCKVTTDRSKLIESDAVIFHARDMSVTDVPPFRLPHQRWVFYCLESPPYSDFPGLQHTQNMFNWTMTYRADSDIPAPYGYVSKIRPPHKLDLLTLEWAWANKSRSVVWMSSHCPTHGGRDSFAEELSKYIDVDIYGSCGTFVCPPDHTESCLQNFAQKYKFFLAFENSLCKDYITEKFYRNLKYNIIPVVFGGANYSKFAPPGSFIDGLSFKTPKHLAFFLKGVGKDFKLYSSYFKWRKDYVINLGNKKECQLCSMLHKKDTKPSFYGDLREWWLRGSSCKVWKPKR